MKKSAKKSKLSAPTPQEVDEILYAFPSHVVGTLLPELGSIPKEFKHGNTSWNKLIEHMFCFGSPADAKFYGKPGIDPAKAFRHIDTCLRSYEPKHEHKEAGCAYLASCFFEKVVFPTDKKEFK